MANITQKGIKFNIQNNFLPGESASGFNGKIYSANNPYYDLENGDDISKLVNAVEIDWNGAELSYLPVSGNQSINTTGQLLSILINELKSLDDRCKTLEQGVQGISDSIEELENVTDQNP